MKVRKRFAQHFLERAWVEKLIARIAPQPGEQFIEIGPGRGALTRPLARSGAHVRAIEIDRDLAAELVAHGLPNVTVVIGDFLDLTAEQILPEGAHSGPPFGEPRVVPVRDTSDRIRVVGNLPYNISSPILFRLLSLARESPRLQDATLMLQREVADRVAAGPGSGDYGPLSILTALHADVDRVLNLPPGAFRPPPRVHSAVIRLRFRPSPVEIADYARFERLVRTIFQQRRKMLGNALAPLLTEPATALLTRADLDGRRRPETLTIAELARLTVHLLPPAGAGGA